VQNFQVSPKFKQFQCVTRNTEYVQYFCKKSNVKFGVLSADGLGIPVFYFLLFTYEI